MIQDDGTVTYYADYFPFGWTMPGRNGGTDYRYAYQGQEKDPETGWEAFELRMYDGRVGRWMTTDPYSQYHSPYLAMGNNPISSIDPDGGFAGPGDGHKNGDYSVAPGVVFNIDDRHTYAQSRVTIYYYHTNGNLMGTGSYFQNWAYSGGDYLPLYHESEDWFKKENYGGGSFGYGGSITQVEWNDISETYSQKLEYSVFGSESAYSPSFGVGVGIFSFGVESSESNIGAQQTSSVSIRFSTWNYTITEDDGTEVEKSFLIPNLPGVEWDIDVPNQQTVYTLDVFKFKRTKASIWAQWNKEYMNPKITIKATVDVKYTNIYPGGVSLFND